MDHAALNINGILLMTRIIHSGLKWKSVLLKKVHADSAGANLQFFIYRHGDVIHLIIILMFPPVFVKLYVEVLPYKIALL